MVRPTEKEREREAGEESTSEAEFVGNLLLTGQLRGR